MVVEGVFSFSVGHNIKKQTMFQIIFTRPFTSVKRKKKHFGELLYLVQTEAVVAFSGLAHGDGHSPAQQSLCWPLYLKT